ncbi:ABC transporter C family member 11-like [Miscanthus floridulus]|uniref:ABC transporter C family member 11-like n=1 Tax=Miscanthus floridulus TaxID=154761 RepID=UPI00345B0AFB
MRPAVPGSGWEDFSSLRKKVIHLGTGTSMPSQFLQECHGGFLLRHSTLRMSCVWIATVFHNSLRLTNDSRRKLASGRITNLISTNVESLQQVFLVLVIIREVCFTSRP